MKFEEALAQFRYELEKEYGIKDGVTKIGLDYPLFDVVRIELLSYSYYNSFQGLGEIVCQGVQLLPRKRDTF